MRILTNLDLGSNQILGLRAETLAADPSGGGLYAGRVWFNSASHTLKYYDGTTVIELGTLPPGSVASLTVDGLTIENIGTSADPSIRVKAGGVTNSHITGPVDFNKLAAPAADFDVNSHKIVNVSTPTAGGDAATKGYVDAFLQGLAPKDSVRAASTANATLGTAFANGQAIDGVTLATGDRILIKNQTAGETNGIYTVNSSGAPTRALDADSETDLIGASVFVSEGTVNGNTQWVMTSDAPITLNTTPLSWSQMAGPGTIVGGNGITVTGNQVAVTVPMSIANGGTNAITAAAALANLGGTTKFSAAIGDNASTAIVVTHNLNSRDVHVTVYDTATFAEVLADIVHTSVNAVTISFAVAPGTNAYRAVVIG